MQKQKNLNFPQNSKFSPQCRTAVACSCKQKSFLREGRTIS